MKNGSLTGVARMLPVHASVTTVTFPWFFYDSVFRHCSRVKLSLFILVVGLAVSLLFRVLEWPWVAFRRAETAVTHGNYRDAAALYERAAQKLDDLRVLEPLAKCWLALGRSREAEAVLARILEKHPDQLSAIKLLSGLYQQSQQPEKAIPLFVQYLGLGGRLDPPAELQLARIYRQAARYDDAAPLYLRAAVEDPKQKSVGDAELAEMRSWQGRY